MSDKHHPTARPSPERDDQAAVDRALKDARVRKIVHNGRTFYAADDVELAMLKGQREYLRRGYPGDWVDKRRGTASTRRELVREWRRRGAGNDSERYRQLTNELVNAAFGMDVQTYRRYKGLSRAGQTLRDHMTDVELALLALTETTATAITRGRNSSTFEQLLADVTEAGRIVAEARAGIERASGRAVIDRSHHREPQIGGTEASKAA